MELILENISKKYEEKEILRDINIKVDKKEFIGLIGFSGAGKSTLLKIIAGLETPTTGKVKLNGEEIKKPTLKIDFLFQDYRIFPWLTVKENIMFALKNINTTNIMNFIEKAYALMDIMELSDKTDYFPHQLSGGLKQRVALCRALIPEPEILLLDEPFSSLDPLTALKSWHLVRYIYEIKNTSFIIVSHNIEEVLFLCDRIIVLDKNPGRILKEINLPQTWERTTELRFKSEFFQLKKQLFYLMTNSGMDEILNIRKKLDKV